MNSQDTKIKQLIDKAKILNLEYSRFGKEENGRYCYIIHKTSNDHILLIPSNVTDIYWYTIYSEIASLRGRLKVIGGSGLVTAENLFSNCHLKELDLSEFTSSNIENMECMFKSSIINYINMNNFDTSKATKLKHMFSYMLTSELDLSTLKIRKDATHRIEIIPHLPLSGNYMVLRNEFSSYGRESLKQVLNILKQERKGVVKTISLSIRLKDKNNRLYRRKLTLGSEYVDDYEEELRNRFGQNVRIEGLRFNRTKPAIIDDKHARTALAIGYVKYAEDIIEDIRDDILKRNLTDFKRINKYDEIIAEYENQNPDFIDEYDTDAIESWRKSKIVEKFKNLNYCDGQGNIKRSLNRDLKKRDNIYQNILKNIASALIIWDIFRYYMTTSNNSRKIDLGPFPYIRVELDREQRKVFQADYIRVIETLNNLTDLKIISIDDKDLLLYEKFKFEKQIRNSHVKFNHVALGAALIHENSDIPLESISNAFNINESRVKKEIKNIDSIKNPKSDKSKKFLELIKK